MSEIILGLNSWEEGKGGGAYDTVTFNANLGYTLQPSVDAGSGYTYTRGATGGTITDFEGLVKPIGDNEATIDGARRVENLATGTDTPVTQSITVIANHKYQVRIGSLSATSSTAVLSGAATGTLTGDATDPQSFDTAKTATTTTLTITITGVVRHLQVEDVTGQTIQNPSEYVSVGGAAEHGTNVVNVKYFNYKNGNTVATGIVTEAAGDTLSASINTGFSSLEGSTNELLQARQFTTTWTTTGTPIVTKDQVGIDGIPNTAWSIEDNSASSAEAITQTITPDPSVDIVASIYFKKDTNEARFPEILFSLTGATAVSHADHINTKTGLITGVTGTQGGTAKIESSGTFWRYQVTILNNTNTSATFTIYPSRATTSGTRSNAAVGTTIFDAAQIEFDTRGGYASAFIDTTTAPVSRPDTFLIQDSSNYTLSGTIYTEINLTDQDTGKQILSFEKATVSDQKLSLVRVGGGNLRLQSNGGGGNKNTEGTLILPLGLNKIAFSWNSAGAIVAFNIVVNGIVDATSSHLIANLPTVLNIDRFSIGHRWNNGTIVHTQDNIRVVKKWDAAKTQHELIALTTI